MAVALAAVLVVAVSRDTVHADTVRVAAGSASRIEVVVPGTARAGESVSVLLTVLDEYGNTVADYNRTGAGVVVSSDPEGAIETTTLPASAFRDGVASMEVVFTDLGVFSLRVVERGGAAEGVSNEISILPGRVASFRLFTPDSARVGEPFTIGLEALDEYGHVVTDYSSRGTAVTITADGIGDISPSYVQAERFSDGRAEILASYDVAEIITLSARAEGAEGASEEISVRAGELDHFDLSVPSRAVAGGNFRVVIEAKDREGNTIYDYDRMGEPVYLSATGSGRLEPNVCPLSAFHDGIAVVDLSYPLAERIGIIASDAGGRRRGESADMVEVSPGLISRIEVLAPEEVGAGIPFSIKIWSYDAHGNLVRDLAGRPYHFVVTAGPDGEVPLLDITARVFEEGVAEADAVLTRMGRTIVRVVEETTGAEGRSAAVEVTAGNPTAFVVEVPDVVRADEPMMLTVRSVDRFGNTVTGYSRIGNGVRIEVVGDAEIYPGTIPPSLFENGSARIRATVNTSADIRVRAIEQGGTAEGLSPVVRIRPSGIESFEVAAPAEMIAGVPSVVTITAHDRFGNIVSNYDALERNIHLRTDYAGPVSPPDIPYASFVGGRAEAPITLFRTGETRIGVREEGGEATGISDPVVIRPANPSHLAITAASSSRVGDPLTVRIEARDAFGNRITDYNPPVTSLAIRTEGASAELANTGGLEFRSGTAILTLEPRSAGRLIVSVEDRVAGLSGVSGEIEVLPGAVDRFEIDVPNPLRVGEPGLVVIRALDRFGNTVTDFGTGGEGVRLTAKGSGILIPSALRGEAFTLGVARVRVVYNRAEEMELSAEALAPGTIRGPEIVLVRSAEAAGTARVTILGNGPLPRPSVTRPSDRIISLAFEGVSSNAVEEEIIPSSGEMIEVMTLSGGIASSPATVDIHLDEGIEYRLARDENTVILDLDRDYTGISAAPPPPEPPKPRPAASVPATTASRAEIEALLSRGRFAEARAALSNYLRLHPQDPWAASIFFRLERMESLGLYGYHLQSPPVPAEVPSSGGSGLGDAEALTREGRYEEALERVNAVLDDDPGDARALGLKRRIESLLRIMEGER